MDLSLHKRIDYARIAASLAFLLIMALSYKLWLPIRNYPLVPVLELPFSIPLNYSLLLSLLASLFVLLSGKWLRAGGALFGLSFIGLVLLDISRLQPYNYMFASMLLIISLAGKGETEEKNQQVADMLRIILIGIYLWAGIHKINPDFIDRFYSFASGGTLNPSGDGMGETLIRYSALFFPLTEIFLAIGLVYHRTRPFAVDLAIIMHLVISMVLSPLGFGWNYIVIPWNLAMIGAVFALFYKATDIPVSRLFSLKPISKVLVILLFLIMPFCNFFGRFDHYLSASLYTFKVPYGRIYVEEDLKQQLPAYVEPYLFDDSSGHYIEVIYWSMGEMNVLPYPEKRVFEQIRGYICSFEKSSSSCTARVVLYK